MTQTQNNAIASLASKFINNTNCHIFLTGKAGTGKTTFLRSIKSNTHKKVLVAAPTGIAAINAQGVTLHSLFHLPFGSFIPSNQIPASQSYTSKITTPQTLIANLKMHNHKRRLLQEAELLIIDEVSMLRADLLDAIDTTLRHVRRQNEKSFGGLQVLFIGDLLQLPPVVKENEKALMNSFYKSPFFFSAKALEEAPPLFIELEKIFRQSDQTFISILNQLRNNKITPEIITELNQYHRPDFNPGDQEGFIYLTTHNYKADEINQQALHKLSGKTYQYTAITQGDFPDHTFPIEPTLSLKQGAQVMFLKNDYSGEQRYFNGKIGKVTSLSKEEIKVSFEDDPEPAIVEPYVWENKKFSINKDNNEIEEKVTGTFTHFPLKLAWAVTIHKSQGLTFDKAIIDVSQSFSPGQIYVALSRLTSLKGLVLSKPIPNDCPPTEEAIESFARTKQGAKTLTTHLSMATQLYARDTALKAFDFHLLNYSCRQHAQSYNKEEGRSIKQQHKNWATNLMGNTQPLVEVASKFQTQINQITAPDNLPNLDLLLQRVVAAKAYFTPRLQQLSEEILNQIKKVNQQKRVKQYTNELKDLELMFFRQQHLILKAEALVKSIINKTELSNNSLKSQELYQKRAIEPTPASKKEASTKKTKKGDSQATSFQLYKKGKNINEIAQERALAISTIENHLTPYVADGTIDISKLVEKTKIKKILKAYKELDTPNLTNLKTKLGNEYTFGEVRLVLASRR